MKKSLMKKNLMKKVLMKKNLKKKKTNITHFKKIIKMIL